MLEILNEKYPENLTARYKIQTGDFTGLQLLEAIGKKRGMLISGGEIDIERAAMTVLDEFRGGKIGNITLEFPEE